MSHGSIPGFARNQGLAFPFLVECDPAGRVLWVSNRTRELAGDPEHLTDLVLATEPPNGRGPGLCVRPHHLWQVWESRGTIVLAALPSFPDPISPDFLRLELALLNKLIKLTAEERRLFDFARQRRGKGAGLAAIRYVERDRQRLGRDLHTGIGQTIAAILLQLEIIRATDPAPPPRARQSLDNIAALAAGALEQVRSVSRRLHPPEWQRLTLESALRQLWSISAVPDRFEAHLQVDQLPREPVPEIKALLYRAMQESLSNLFRHSRATRVEARLASADGRVTLTVADNGVGFDTNGLRAAEASLASGIGLRSIRQQATGVGGDFDIESGPQGTKLVISVALAPSEY